MGKTRKTYAIMANRKKLWLVSVVMIALGLIFNIINGARPDIQFTGGAMLRYSYPESGIVSVSDLPASTRPADISDSDMNNGQPDPAEVPVIVSGGDVSDSDLPEETLSGTELMPENDSGQSSAVPDIQIEPDYSTEVDADKAARVISDVLSETVTVQVSTDAHSPTGGDNKRLTVTFGSSRTIDSDTDAKIRAVMSEQYPNVRLTLRESNSVDPAVGSEFLGKCVMAMAAASLFVMVYVGLRFRQMGGWTAGASALIAVLHDCLAAYFAFVIFGYYIDENFIAVLLAVIGHSLNSTIVVFDRMREKRALLGDSVSVAELADSSINETLGRTVCTDLCVFIAAAVLAVVSAVCGLESMLSFAVPMMFGVAAGCYSSLCISGTIWVTWQEVIIKRRASDGGETD